VSDSSSGSSLCCGHGTGPFVLLGDRRLGRKGFLSVHM
jgi:hypothetical protein